MYFGAERISSVKYPHPRPSKIIHFICTNTHLDQIAEHIDRIAPSKARLHFAFEQKRIRAKCEMDIDTFFVFFFGYPKINKWVYMYTSIRTINLAYFSKHARIISILQKKAYNMVCNESKHELMMTSHRRACTYKWNLTLRDSID